MNEDIKDWINKVKQMKMLDEIQKKQLIQFDNYFKYSGKTEEYKEAHTWEKNKIKYKEVDSNDPIVKFYFKNSNYTMNEIGQVFGLSGSCVRVRIGDHLNINKKIRNGKNIENGECK